MIDWTGFTWGGAAEIFFVTLGAVLGIGVLALGVIWAITGLYHLVMWIAENLQDWWEERQFSKAYIRRELIKKDSGEVVERHISLSKDAGRIVDTPKRHELVAHFYGEDFADSLEGVEVQKCLDERKSDRAKKSGKLLGSVNQHKHMWYFLESETVHDVMMLRGGTIYKFYCRCEEEWTITAWAFWGSPTIRYERALAEQEVIHKNKQAYEEEIQKLQNWVDGSGKLREGDRDSNS